MLRNTDLQTSFRRRNVRRSSTLIASEVILKYYYGEDLRLPKNFCCGVPSADWDRCRNVFRRAWGMRRRNNIKTTRRSTWWDSHIQPVPIFIGSNFTRWFILSNEAVSTWNRVKPRPAPTLSSALCRRHNRQIRKMRQFTFNGKKHQWKIGSWAASFALFGDFSMVPEGREIDSRLQKDDGESWSSEQSEWNMFAKLCLSKLCSGIDPPPHHPSQEGVSTFGLVGARLASNTSPLLCLWWIVATGQVRSPENMSQFIPITLWRRTAGSPRHTPWHVLGRSCKFQASGRDLEDRTKRREKQNWHERGN